MKKNETEIEEIVINADILETLRLLYNSQDEQKLGGVVRRIAGMIARERIRHEQNSINKGTKITIADINQAKSEIKEKYTNSRKVTNSEIKRTITTNAIATHLGISSHTIKHIIEDFEERQNPELPDPFFAALIAHSQNFDKESLVKIWDKGSRRLKDLIQESGLDESKALAVIQPILDDIERNQKRTIKEKKALIQSIEEKNKNKKIRDYDPKIPFAPPRENEIVRFDLSLSKKPSRRKAK
jgi:DNA-binding MarR family transcriptional regulator